MKSVKYLMRISLGVFAALIVNATEDSSMMLRIEGKVMYSLVPDSFLMQTDSYVYKIEKSELSLDQKNIFEKASLGGKKAKLDVPRAAVSMMWPSQPYRAEVDASAQFAKLAARVQQDVKLNHGEFRLKGTSLYSFNESFALVQVGNEVYQIKKSALDDSQIKKLTEVGSTIDTVLPQKSIELSWAYKNTPQRQVASITKGELEVVSFNANEVSLRGTLLCSFEDPMILVQSEGAIFQIRKDAVKTNRLAALDKPGSFVDVKAPLSSVEFVWSGDGKELQFNRRLPASQP